MAARRKNAPVTEIPTTPFDVLVTLVEMASTEDNPTTVEEIADDVADFPSKIIPILSRLVDAGIVEEGENGFFLIMDVSKTNAAQILAEYLNETPQSVKAEPVPAEKVEKPKRVRRTQAQIAADKEEARKRLEYDTRAAETQDAVMSQAAPAKLFTAAPDALPKGTKVTLSDGSEGTVISDEIVRIKVTSYVESLTRLIADMTTQRDNATNVRDDYTAPKEVTPPPMPKGVAENTWNAAHNAYGPSERDTLSARLFYLNRALAQHTEALAA